jgi:hypothetical protein
MIDLLTDHVDVAQRTRRALDHIYEQLETFRNQSTGLPKLLSILQSLEPSQKRLFQSLLVNLPSEIAWSLGCYFHVLDMTCRSQSFQYRTTTLSSSSSVFEQWHKLEASAVLSRRLRLRFKFSDCMHPVFYYYAFPDTCRCSISPGPGPFPCERGSRLSSG